MMYHFLHAIGYERCRYCTEWRAPIFDWSTMLTLQQERLLCLTCEALLAEASLINNPTCTLCGRAVDKGTERCVYCQQAPPPIANTSLYAYTPEMKEWVTALKFKGDVTVATIFHRQVARAITASRADIIVAIPLSQERYRERGCNVVEELAPSTITFTECLGKHHREKQSKKTKRERLLSENPFYWTGKENAVTSKKVLLLDDIYTTGTTVSHAATILRENGAQEVQSLTVWRG